MLDALRGVPLFRDWIDKGAECFAFLEQGEEVRLRPGEQLVAEGDPPNFYILLEGDLRIVKHIGGQQMVLATWRPGTFFGELPLLLDMPTPASGYAVGECHLFRLRKDAFWQMIGACPVLTRTILRTMAERVRNLESVGQGHAKLASLGTLAAGLAHELNNPAAAARRCGAQGRETYHALQSLTLRLHRRRLTPEHWELLQGAAQNAAERAHTRDAMLDPLAESEREDELTAWLEAHQVTGGWNLAPALARAGLAPEHLEALATNLPPDALEDALHWLDGTLTMEALWDDLGSSTARISELVDAVRGYSFLDQAPLQDIDIHEGLEATLTVLAHKIGGVAVTRDYDRGLPRLCAYGGALNQLWTNLLDNALDAVGGNGQITIRTSREGDNVLVEIADTGPGIPLELQERIFEPFFTTKGVGKGTGLGLVTSYRIVAQHRGDIRLDSTPGAGTRVEVRLPIALRSETV